MTDGVTAHFASGRICEGDILVGADDFVQEFARNCSMMANPFIAVTNVGAAFAICPPGKVLTETLGLGVRVGIRPDCSRGTCLVVYGQ